VEGKQKPAPSLPRAEAERLLELVIAKAEFVNAHPEEFPYAVQTLAVFGSYLTEKPVLGDLDIAIELKLVRRLEYHGKFSRPVHWGDKTTKALRLRRPRKISVHFLAEVREMGAPFREIFQRND
jgi:hypothetical protein